MHNQIPTRSPKYKLAIIGEGPSEEDRMEGQPFSGTSGRMVTDLTARLGIPKIDLFLGYVSTKRSSKFYPLTPTSPHVVEACRVLEQDLARYNPHCCLVMGDLANKVFGFEHSIYQGRGTIYHSHIFNRKCVATYDIGEVMRNYIWKFPLDLDIGKAVQQSASPVLELPNRSINSYPTYDQVILNLVDILDRKPIISFDLEGHPDNVGVTCYSVAEHPNNPFIVPIRNLDGSPFWSLEQEMEIWRLTSLILTDPAIPKICQNGMYELFVFAWRHGILVRGLSEDTLYQMWELYCEQPKDLGFISSIFTLEPYYKSERTIPDISVHHEYCCKDSAVTLEAAQKMEVQLAKHEPSQKHYQFNIRLQKPYLYMQLRGCKLDVAKLQDKRQETWSKIQTQQAIVNEMTNRVFNVKSPPQKNTYLYDELSLPPQYKLEAGEKKLTSDFGALCTLYVQSQLPVILEIAKLVRLRTRFSDINKLSPFPDGRIRSNYNPVGTETGRLSSSETWVEDLVSLPKIVFKTRSKNKVKYQEMVLESITKLAKLGTNLQNVTKDLRDLFIPDSPDFDFFQYDLSGADAWTVAADLAALGNDRMLVHLQHKIKPSIVIVLLIEHGPDVYKWDLDHLKTVHDATLKAVKTIPRLNKSYVCAKACQHGTNYGMEPPLMAAVQLERSIAGWIDNFNSGIIDPIDFQGVHPYIMDSYQRQYIGYYGLELRNNWIEKQLINFGYIDSATGHRRRFQSIRTRKRIDPSVLRAAASHEPQANTTYATNAALANMFYDLDNRTPRGFLRCEPTLMIHDALAGQAHKSQRQWAEEKMSTWFHNPLLIHGIEINIPVEGGWGPNWKQTD